MKRYLQFLCFLLLAPVAIGQHIKLTRAAQPNNFSSIGVGTEDPKGYMWFGSQNGVFRYDGYHFLTYINDPLDSNSLANNRIECIYAARDGSIWIGTQTTGLDRLDPATGKFTHFRHDRADSMLTSDNVTAIAEDRNGMMWIGTHRGLNMIDPRTKKVTRYQHNPTDENSLSQDQVRVIYEDRKGTLWIGTGSAFAQNTDNSGGLNRFIPETKSFKRYLHDPNDQKSLIDNRVRAIFEDSHGVFWVGTAGDGLHTMDREKGKFTRHTFDPRHPENLSRGPLKKVYSWATDHITFINEDAAGYIWIGTLGNGVNRYDYKTGNIVNIPDEITKNGNVRMENSWWCHSSRDGVLWIGYWSGAYTYDPLRTQLPFVETGYSVVSILKDSLYLWIGSEDMLVRKNLKSGEEKHFTNDPLHLDGLKNHYIRSLYKDSHNNIWIGTDSGLHKYDGRTEKFSAFKISPKYEIDLNINLPYSIIEDKSGEMWVSTVRDGLIRINSHLGKITRYSGNNGDTSKLTLGNITSVTEDADGNIWVGLYLLGVNKLYPKTGKVEHYLNGTTVNNITQDSFGVIWVATENGLYASNREKNSFSLLRDVYNEIPKNLNIGAVIEDADNTLWVSTSIGIVKVNSKRDKMMLWAKIIQVDRYGFKSKEGQLYFGTPNGYFAFYPSELKNNNHPPHIAINEFRIADVPVTLKNDTLIHLNHKQNSFSFQFAGIHFSDPTRNHHLYMLEGVDNTWRNGGSEKLAYYNNVAPGNYVFHIKAANSDGIWAERKINIIIHPPWWRTWWAYILYAIAVVSFIWAFVYFRLKSLRSQLVSKEKEKQFEELRRQKTEIEMQALRAQMNPHFIFNSLNSINRFILHNNKNDASEYLSKFSRLVRLILNNSQASSIPLQNELEALELYLELESLRFDNHFNFKITVAPDIDASILKVPPLMIQPFAENAIWHGLMHKKEQGNLDIEITSGEGMLICKVRDDGIGRKKASELKSKSRVSHRSYGMKITASRIDLLQQQHVNGSSIVISDLVLPDNSPSGTEVILKLPVSYD